MSSYQDLEPKAVFHWFYELNQIPRGSGNEKAVSDWLVKFAKDRGLQVEQDAAWNVIIHKPATPGYEKANTVIVQGHMDMVPEKAADSNHDFLKDPIEMVVKGEMLYANKTTLGGDDGIAVAFALAVLDSKDIPHPPLEVLITTNEETGMDGAMAIKKGMLTGKYLLNIDSEEEGIFLVSCAGGANVHLYWPAKKVEGAAKKALKVTVKGLLGGHSGMQIVLSRGNAIKILARLLKEVGKIAPFELAHFEGGSKHNAIPLLAEATVATADLAKAKAAMEKIAAEIKVEYQTTDPGLEFVFEEVEAKAFYGAKESANVVDFFAAAPDGMQRMSPDIKGLVQTSLNLAILTEEEEGWHMVTSVRSSVLSERAALIDRVIILGERTGARSEITSVYPAWAYNPDSPLREKVLEVYRKQTGKEPEVTAIHAGLECGLLKEVMPDTDMISFGPNLYDVHTSNEHMEIASAKRVYEFFVALLAAMKDM